MSLLRTDAINIIARSPYLVLFGRLGNHPIQWLDEPLVRGELMERRVHEACFMSCNGFCLIHRCMPTPRRMDWRYKDAWIQEHRAETAQLIQHTHNKGPAHSINFEHLRKSANGQWEWRPYKRHLESLFTAGGVTVIEQHSFQRVYGLTHRVMPDWDGEHDLVS